MGAIRLVDWTRAARYLDSPTHNGMVYVADPQDYESVYSASDRNVAAEFIDQ
jgi:hypothetical protein